MPDKNMLAGQASPYLQQHKDNPVHWQPWGTDALNTAIETGKPILLSIGYAACHWCHVMAHESFEDVEVANVMNELFVNIKVDREERPDIDQIYMAALTATGEQGGWPLTMFLTPDGKPFWGGTYFPKTPKYGRPGFIQVMQSVHNAWKERKDDINSSAQQLLSHVSERLSSTGTSMEPTTAPVVELGNRLMSILDPVHGGIKGAPKFPNAPYVRTLWLSAFETGNRSMIGTIAESLEKMLLGGIYDQVGGGLCRYATDEQWIIPHFEKMLYDNAQLIADCVLAHAHTGNKLFRNRIEETVEWLEREMASPSGAYTSSLDADSEGEEGKYYLWNETEVRHILGADAETFFNHFELASPAMWEDDPVIIRRASTAAERLTDIRQTLLKEREKRIRPGRDDKVLTDWNGLAISAIASAASHFGRSDWAGFAMRAYEAVMGSAEPDGSLPHSVKGSVKLFPALSADYAAMINASVSLFELDADPSFIMTANSLLAILDEDYGDGEGGHFLTSKSAGDVPIRIRGDVDEAVPSATGQIIEAMARLAVVTGDPDLLDRTHKSASAALGRAMRQSHGQAGIFNAASLVSTMSKLVITGDREDTGLAAVARSHPDPRRIDILAKAGLPKDVINIPGVDAFPSDAPAAYYCTGQSCLPPISRAEDLEALLTKQSSYNKG